MSGTLALAEAAVAAVAARLEDQISGLAVEMSRRSPVDVDNEALPRAVVRVADGGIDADLTMSQVQPFYRIPVAVVGYAAGDDDAAAEAAVSALHAQVVAALSYWTPDDAGLCDLADRGAEFVLFAAEECARPAGSFSARFDLWAIGQTAAGPWSS